MQVSPKSKKKLLSKIGSIATAVAFTLVIGSFGVGSARADNHRGDDRGRGGDQHRDNDNHGHRGPAVVYVPRPDYYYTPRLNYYAPPEPDYYYGPGPGTARRRPRVSTSSLAFDRENLSTVVS
jgi:hypothetical protein